MMFKRLALVVLSFHFLTGFARAQVQEAPVNAQLIQHFEHSDPSKTRFGAFEFIGGMVLRSDNQHFGAVSGMRIEGHSKLTAVTDTGFWLQGKIKRAADGVPIGIDSGTMAPVLGTNGKPFEHKWDSDIEGLTFSNGIAFVSAEMDMRVLRFGRSDELPKTPSIRLTEPFNVDDFRNSFSFEAIATLPKDHAYYPGLIVLTEIDRERRGRAPAFILIGGKLQKLAMRQKDGFFITDADFLPSGDMLVLERRYSLARGAGMRLRRIKGSGIVPGALLDGDTLLEASERHAIDNMEALSVFTAPDGSTRIALMSDNNHWLMQRTLYLEFKLAE